MRRITAKHLAINNFQCRASVESEIEVKLSSNSGDFIVPDSMGNETYPDACSNSVVVVLGVP